MPHNVQELPHGAVEYTILGISKKRPLKNRSSSTRKKKETQRKREAPAAAEEEVY